MAKKRSGCTIVFAAIGLFFLIGMVSSLTSGNRAETERQEAAAAAQRAADELAQKKAAEKAAQGAAFSAGIAERYAALKSAVAAKDYVAARKELAGFSGAAAMDYQDVAAIDKQIQEPETLARIAALPEDKLAERIALTQHLVEVAPQNAEYAASLTKLKTDLQEQNRKAAEAEAARVKEQQRLADLERLGIWQVSNYVDEFNKDTAKKYVTNERMISGKFSNSATEGSPLAVRLLIDGKDEIAIVLHEYAGKNPVKATAAFPQNYTISVLDQDGTRYSLAAINRSDRLKLAAGDSRTLSGVFLKGGKVLFRIDHDERSTDHYNFEILSTKWYENALRKISE